MLSGRQTVIQKGGRRRYCSAAGTAGRGCPGEGLVRQTQMEERAVPTQGPCSEEQLQTRLGGQGAAEVGNWQGTEVEEKPTLRCLLG